MIFQIVTIRNLIYGCIVTASGAFPLEKVANVVGTSRPNFINRYFLNDLELEYN